MNERLHPLTLGEILDRTAQMYRTQFLRFVGIAAIPMGVLLVFTAVAVGFIAWAMGEPARGFSGNPLGILIFAVLGVLGVVGLPVCTGAMALSWAALTDAAATTFLGGTFTIRAAYGSAWKRRWRVLWLLTMDTLFLGVIPGSAVIALLTIPGLAGALAGKAGLGALSVLSTVVMFALIAALALGALWLLLRLCLGFAACVAEQVSAWQALKRSWVLSKGTKGRLIVVFLLGYALEYVLTIGSYIPVAIAIYLIPGANGQQHADTVNAVMMFAIYGLWFVVKTLLRPVYGIALMLFYFDQRIRKEGFDVEWMMRHAGMQSAAVAVEEPMALSGASPWLVLPEEPAGGSGE